MRTFILISWLLLALLNFSIIREASSAACTTSPTANEMVLTAYSGSCQGSALSSATVRNNVCTQLSQFFGGYYVKADCATGSYTYYVDSACSSRPVTTCQNSCDFNNVIAKCTYVK